MSKWKDQLSEPVTYPEYPGFKETGGASEAAADRLAPMLKRNQIEALEAFRRAGRPMTADELADFMGKSIVSVRPRVSELRRLGKIVATGERRPSSYGQPSSVWMLKSERPAEARVAIPAVLAAQSSPSIEGPTPRWHWTGRAFSVTREQYGQWSLAFPHISLSIVLQTIDDTQAIDGDLRRVFELLSSANEAAR